MAPEHLPASQLGTKEYWEQAYANEIVNHQAEPSDEGTVWFSDAAAEERVLDFLESLSDEGVLSKSTASFVDIGTGNGHMLFSLREEGWEGSLVGVDYSQQSIDLAIQIVDSKTRGIVIDDNVPPDRLALQFRKWDIMKDPPGDWFPPEDGLDVALDKGTFDAISLSSELDEQGRRLCEGYGDRLQRLVRPGGLLIITSCNWTEDEVISWLISDESNLVLRDRIKYPTYTFGGRSGQQVVTLCFQKDEKA
ncbi:S-adenosyl-L-methionine-dependent methyltransferase [Eremomyces bilateralis CBS 781.70]|uniref:Protein-lysine N-methyltransferase EFM4 n=1 Tax=Eremomyces bilateralis CBS 781.70 TaxID=1392243 RepID=A0A6G1GFQ0_9PEZI|nr:S-adenosyl-L-methionine-dependent methyltransferase [Eremomyces bilateralis CBS 781.70]KAF1816746.1 S-adenosyl-L-methionine-dependent methyltransferase [Eremomyces bilateralis CBS 781.70]